MCKRFQPVLIDTVFLKEKMNRCFCCKKHFLGGELVAFLEHETPYSVNLLPLYSVMVSSFTLDRIIRLRGMVVK